MPAMLNLTTLASTKLLSRPKPTMTNLMLILLHELTIADKLMDIFVILRPRLISLRLVWVILKPWSISIRQKLPITTQIGKHSSLKVNNFQTDLAT